jgi:hypothetical protein
VLAANPANWGLFDESPEILLRVGLRGGGCRPHRTGLRLKFPANREKNREFPVNRPPESILAPNRLLNSVAYSKIPYATEQGIISCEQGIFYKEQGVFTPNGTTLDFAFLNPTKDPGIGRSHHVLKGNFSIRAHCGSCLAPPIPDRSGGL